MIYDVDINKVLLYKDVPLVKGVLNFLLVKKMTKEGYTVVNNASKNQRI